MYFIFTKTNKKFRHNIHLVIKYYLAILLALSTPLHAFQLAETLPSLTALENRLLQARSDTSMEESQRELAISQLQQLINRREATLELEKQTADFTQAVSNAASRQNRLEKQFKNLKEKALSKAIKKAPLTELETIVAKDDSQLVTLRKHYSQVAADIRNEKSFDIQVALDEARQALQLIKLESQPAQDEALARLIQQVSLAFHQAKVENFQQRLFSRNLRLAHWELQQKILSKQIDLLESRLTQIRTLISDHRQTAANQMITQGEAQRQSLDGQARLLIQLADKNLQLAKEFNQLIAKQELTLKEKDKATQESQKLNQKYESLTEQLAISQLGNSPEFGAALRLQRDQIADERRSVAALKRQQEALTESRLAQFKIDALRESVNEQELASHLAALKKDPAVEVTNEHTKVLDDLLASRTSILEKLSSTYWSYIGHLTSLTILSSSLIEQRTHYAELLDQQLLWMPSAFMVGKSSLQALDDSITWLINDTAWQSIASTEIFSNYSSTLFILLIALAQLGLVSSRRRLATALSTMKNKVGRVSRDTISLTLSALIITALLALPGPILLFTLAIFSNFSVTESDALVNALVYGGLVYLLLAFLLQSVKKHGLLTLHFDWNHDNAKALKDNLPWFILLIIPALIINMIIEVSGSFEARNSLGRLVFMLESLAMMFFGRRVLPKVRSSWWGEKTKQNSNISSWAYANLRFTLIYLMPLTLISMSLYGYHYSAVQMANHLINSALVLLAGILSYCLTQRVFTINERRLALEKLKARRAAAVAAQNLTEEELEEMEDNAPSAIDLQEIDLQSISKQTKTLLKLVFSVVAFVALWNVWTNIFPAFKPLINVELWQVHELRDGVNASISITWWHLLLSLLALIITYLSAKNISGLLDAALLSRVPLEPGTSYAITTVAQYIIVIVGVVFALQSLGAQWAKLQWLIAALSVGLGFGLQEIVANFVSGIVILFERPFRIGDTVTIGDQWGTVTKIRMRATTISDWDRREIIVPNKAFIQERLTNWTLTDAVTRRKISVGVAYGSDVDLVEKLLLEIAEENSKVLDEPTPEAYFLGFGDSSLDFSLRIFVRGHREHAAVVHEIHKAIDSKFKANGISIAFPQRDIHFDPKPISVKLLSSQEEDKTK